MLDILLWSFVTGFDHQLRLTDLVSVRGMGRPVDRDRVELALAQVIDGVVVRDLEDSVTELVTGLVAADRVEGSNKSFLR